MPTTPSQQDLDHVNDEVETVSSFAFANGSNVAIEPTKLDVLRYIREYIDLVHFACHGFSFPRDPSQSRLLLTDWESDSLTVADIVKLKLNATLAFLSACHAARNREASLLDEGIHLAGAFQLAGFSHVIGTLWQIHDAYSVQVARNIYQFIGIDASLSAEALHRAIRTLRDTELTKSGFKIRLREDPLVWAAYIHMGKGQL
jgi:CHAT domain-containing protein